MLDLVKKWVPHTYQAFINNNKTGKNFSGPSLEIIKKMLKGEKITAENCGLSSREWRELLQTLDLKQ
jgi:thymidylate synthase (FAD)